MSAHVTLNWTANAEQETMLETAATAMNGVSWCMNDNTAQSVFNEFVLPWALDMLQSRESLIGAITESIDTGEEDMNAEHTRKIAELSEALRKALLR